MSCKNAIVRNAIAWTNYEDPLFSKWERTREWAEAKRENRHDIIGAMRRRLSGSALAQFDKDVEDHRRRLWGQMAKGYTPSSLNFRSESSIAKERGLAGALRLAKPTLTLGQLDMVEGDINAYAKALSVYPQALSLVKELRTKINRSLDEMEEMNDTTYSPSARKNMSGSMGDSIYKLQGLLKSGISEVRKQA